MNSPIQRRVRWYQRPLHEHLVSGGKRAIVCAHRRWGKDEIALQTVSQLALSAPGNYWHCLPEFEQGRRAIWSAVNPHTGRRRIDEAFPPQFRLTANEQQMFIRLHNQSTWQIIGADKYDSTVGSSPAGIVYSEWALSNPSAWGYHRPILEENNGFALFISTPRGKNHFHTMYQHALRNPQTWYAEHSPVTHTRALSRAQLAASLAEYQSIYGEDAGLAIFAQEYLCSFEASLPGAFYTREISRLRASGRVSQSLVESRFDPLRPVHRAWDIGMRDDTSVWFFQVSGYAPEAVPLILDCYSISGVGVEEHAARVRGIRQAHGWTAPGSLDFVPHDAKVREWGTGRTRVEAMREFHLSPVLCPLASKLDGIQAARRTLDLAIVHPRCEDPGLSALANYRRKWDDTLKTFSPNEIHDDASHPADAFRYLSLCWQGLSPPREQLVREIVTALPGNWKLPTFPDDPGDSVSRRTIRFG